MICFIHNIGNVFFENHTFLESLSFAGISYMELVLFIYLSSNSSLYVDIDFA